MATTSTIIPLTGTNLNFTRLEDWHQLILPFISLVETPQPVKSPHSDQGSNPDPLFPGDPIK